MAGAGLLLVGGLSVAALQFLGGGQDTPSGTDAAGESGSGKSAPVAISDDDPDLIVRRDLNFALAIPDDWSRRAAVRMDSDQAAVLESGSPAKLRCSVYATPLGDAATAEAMLNQSRQQLLAVRHFGDVRVRQSESYSGISFTRVQCASTPGRIDGADEGASHGASWWMGVHRGTFYTINVEAQRPVAGPEIAIAGSRLMEGFRFIDPKAAVNPRHLEFVHHLAHFEARPDPDGDASLELRADRKLRLVEWPEAYDGGRMPDAIALLPHCNGGYRSHDGIYLAISSFIAPAGELDASGLLRAGRRLWLPGATLDGSAVEAATACGQPARELAGGAEVGEQLVRFRMRAASVGMRHLVLIAMSLRDGDRDDADLGRALDAVGWADTGDFAADVLDENGWARNGADCAAYRTLLATLGEDLGENDETQEAIARYRAAIRWEHRASLNFRYLRPYCLLLAGAERRELIDDLVERADLRNPERHDYAGWAAMLLELHGERQRATEFVAQMFRQCGPQGFDGIHKLSGEVDKNDIAYDLLQRGYREFLSITPEAKTAPASGHLLTHAARVAAQHLARHPNPPPDSAIASGLDTYARAHPDIAFQLVRTLIRNRQQAAAIAVADALRRTDERSGASELTQALLALENDDYDAAQAAFDRATEAVPESRHLPEIYRRLHAMWKGKLETERAIANEGEPELELPARIAAQLKAATGVPDDSGAFYRSMAKVIEARPGAPAVTLVQGVLEVRDAESAENFNTLRFMLSSDQERYLLRRLVVTDLEGAELARSGGQDMHTQTADPNMATDALILNVPVPGLRAGSRVEFELLRWYEGSIAGPAMQLRHQFGAGIPVLREALVVVGPSIGEALVEGEVRAHKDRGYRAWISDNPAPSAAEEWAPRERARSSVMLGVGLRDWWQIGHEYWLSIEPKFVSHPELVKEAGEIVSQGGAGGAEQAITQFVRDEVSYLAIEFGHRAIIPKPALQTLNDRYGDCKDQSTLLCNMLRAAGIEARPALVRLNGSVREELASMAQFDHMIVAVRDERTEGGWRWIDPTQRAVPPEGRSPYFLGGKFALIVGPEGGRPARLPGGDAPDGTSRIERAIDFRGAEIAVTETLTLSDYHSGRYAPYFSSIEEKDRPELAAELLFGEAPVGIELEQIELLDSDNGRLRVGLRYTASAAAISAGGASSARLPLQTEARLLMPPEARGGRQLDVQAPAGLAVETSTTATRDGEPLVPAAPAEGGGKSRFASWELSAGENAHHQRFELSARVFDRSELGEFRKAVAAGLADAQNRFIFNGAPGAVAGESPRP